MTKNISNNCKDLLHLEYLEELLCAQKQRVTYTDSQRDNELKKIEFFKNKFAEEKLTKKLSAFFQERDMVIMKCDSGIRSTEYYKLAKQIWNAKEILLPFIKEIPQCVATKKERKFEYNVEKLTPDQQNQLRNFCSYIQNEKKWFSFEISNGTFQIELSSHNNYLPFFTGCWAEEVTIYFIDKALKKFTEENGLKYKLAPRQ